MLGRYREALIFWGGKYVEILVFFSSLHLNRSSYEAGTKNQNVANKQMKATIIVLNATCTFNI